MNVLLVDDHTLVRKGLAEVLRSAVGGVEVTEASTADEAVEVLKGSSHDVALVDIRMPGRDGIELLRELRATRPSLPVIMLTSFDNGEYVKTALSEGAAGYLLKDASPEDLAQAILVALSGSGNVLSARAVRNLLDGAAQPQESDQREALAGTGLTRRETDVLGLLPGGASNREISRQLYLSEKTVKAHLAAVFRKLGVTNRTQAAMAAVSMGMGSPQSSISASRVSTNGSGEAG
jgi:DNA-binding NarL/FixJ family response regulator